MEKRVSHQHNINQTENSPASALLGVKGMGPVSSGLWVQYILFALEYFLNG